MTYYLDFLFRHGRAIASVCVILGLTACLGLLSISVTSDTRVFFARDNPHLIQLEAFEGSYSQNNNVLFVIAARSGTLMNEDHLASLRRFTESAWSLPHSLRVDSLANFPHMETRGDEFLIGDLIPDKDVLSGPDVAKVMETSLGDPLLVNRLISRDLTTAGVNVNFKLPAEGSEAINAINAAALALARDFESQNPGLEVHVTGNVVLMQAFSKAALRDIRFLLPLSVLVIVFVLIITLRSLSETIAISGILAFSAAIATSATGWLSLSLNTATVVAPIIIMTLALASCIHVITAVHRHMREGMAQTEAIRAALTENIHPVVMTSITTIIGFLALNFADAPPFQSLGNLVIAGIAINFIFTFTLLPLVLQRLKIRERPSTNPMDPTKLARAIRLNTWPILLIGPILIVTSTLGILRLTLDDDFVRYFDESFSYRTASDFTEARLTGLNILEFSLDSGSEDGIFNPAYQTRVDDFTRWLRAQEKVANVTSIADYTKRLNKHLSDKGQATIPQDRKMIAQYYLLMDMGLPEGRSLSEVINTDQSASRVSAVLRNATSGDIRRMNEAASGWLKTNAPAQETTGISINVLFSHLSINNIRSMINGTVLSFLAISIVIMVLLRSVTLGTLSLLANSIPALVGFGLWGLLVGTVNLGASVLVAMTLGIVVDDTIHYLVAWQHHRKAGATAGEAAAEALQTVGPAMIITTIALIAGFCVLSLSGFDVNRTLGTFTAIIIAVALAVDLFMLPSALNLIGRRRRENGPEKTATNTLPS